MYCIMVTNFLSDVEEGGETAFPYLGKTITYNNLTTAMFPVYVPCPRPVLCLTVRTKGIYTTHGYNNIRIYYT